MDERDRLIRMVNVLDVPVTLPLSDPGLLEVTPAVEALRRAGLEAQIVGPFDHRALLARRGSADDEWLVGALSGEPLNRFPWPAWADAGLQIEDEGSWISRATVDPEVLRRFARPRILIAALYHQEHFPLPRFALGISNLAHAARSTYSGEVRLLDMQLGATIMDVEAEVLRYQPDIVGVSATFGQYDLLIELLEKLDRVEEGPAVVVGGSLVARVETLLLERFPRLIVAHGAGETVIVDLIATHHGDLSLSGVRGIKFNQVAPRGATTLTLIKKNARPVNRLLSDTTPELDLLGQTFASGGVAQLEASRGCTNACSFCPRGHKGLWASAPAGSLRPVLTAMTDVFDQFPETSRTLYLVDEEFIGGEDDAVERALRVAQDLADLGFQWESSCRVDQVVDPTCDVAWHVARAEMWRRLKELGLRRMLFGVESGVTSILDRFNKETTGEQNVLAIRTLSALGIPTRFTYITFDHLMSYQELRSTTSFQARQDLILRPLPTLSVKEIVKGVRDEAFVARHATGQPFYTAISYMMVSMECLIGAPYTRKVSEAGLTGSADPQMGRIAADYFDWRIGIVSDAAQRWVDRNFALDYLLKSFEKLLEGSERRAVHAARVELRRAAFGLLERMVELIAGFDQGRAEAVALTAQVRAELDERWTRLTIELEPTLRAVSTALPSALAVRLQRQMATWRASTKWSLINSSDGC